MMPGGDGTGPFRQKPGTGRGLGRKGQEPGKRSQRPGSGPEGQCVCPACGSLAAHQPGMSCMQTACLQYGQPMTRK